MGEEEALNNALVWGEQCVEKEIARFACPIERLFVLTDYQAKAVPEDARCPFSRTVGKQCAGDRWGVCSTSAAFTSAIAFRRGAGA